MSPTMVAMLAAITKLVSKCVRRINEQLLKTSGADVLLSMEILRKTSERGGTPPPPHPPRASEGYHFVGLKGAMLPGYCCFGVNSVLAPSPPSLFCIWLPG